MEQGTIIEILKCLAPPIYNYVHLSRHLRDTMKELTKNLEELNGKKADIERRIETEVRCDNDVKSQVENWLKRVDDINEQVKDVEQKSQNVSCLCRGRLAKRALEKIVEVKEEVNKAISSSEEIVIDQPPARGTILSTQNVDVGVQNHVKYRESVEGEIMGYLLADDDAVGIIGVWGPGGVGKTTILKNINNNLSSLKDSKFDKVIWAALPYPFNKVKLQDEIASAMEEDLPEKLSEAQRAAKLLKIMKGKKSVLLLDDAWEKFSFDDVGIPIPTQDNGCKVVITSRSADLCSYLDCARQVQVQRLLPEVAVQLFLDTLGFDVVSKIPDVADTLKAVVNECAGLPLAINAIAKSMRNANDILAWRNALTELRSCVAGVKDWDDEIFPQLMFSYKRLKNEEQQNCFLFCSLYSKSEYIRREELINCWIDGGLINQMKPRQAMFDRASEILNKLINDCLLEEGVYYGESSIRMHDIMRNMAVRIADTRFMVKAGLNLNEIPEEGEWTQNLEKVSLMRNYISKISRNVCPNCPKLNTLLLSKCHLLSIIPESFFKSMPVLQFLNLSDSRLTALPSSIYSLTSLTTLLLRNCAWLKYVPSLEKLKALKKLDLHGAGIVAVPEGIAELVSLQHLDLYCPRLVEFPIQILKNLFHLEFLAVNFSSSWSSAEYLTKSKGVTRLKMLERFVAAFSNLKGLSKYVEFFHQVQKPSKYSLQVGREYQDLFGGDSTKEVIIENLNINKEEEEFSILLPNDLQSLKVIDCSGVESLSEISMLDTRADLRLCEIAGGSLQCILDLSSSPSSSSSVSCNLFDTCESLYVSNMDDLHLLVKGGPRGRATSASSASHVASSSSTPSSTVFSNLKTFKISRCGKIKKLFPIELLKGLLNLEEIHVSDCDEMEEIIQVEEENKKVVLTRGNNIEIVTIFITLSKLRVLVLNNLRNLKSIFAAAKGVMVCDSIQWIQINKCSKLDRIPLHFSSRPRSDLEIRVDTRVWWEFLEWDMNPATKDILASFLRPDSDELSLARVFDDLQDLNKFVKTLQERHLSSYKYIVEAKSNDDDDDGVAAIRFERRFPIQEDVSKSLTLHRVQMHGDYPVLLPNDLECLKIINCNGMERSPFSKAEANLIACLIQHCKELECLLELLQSSSLYKMLDELRCLMLSNLPNLELLVKLENQATLPSIFSNLKTFVVYQCPKINKLFPSTLLNCLNNLEQMHIIDCAEMEEIIHTDQVQEGEQETGSIEFPKLKKLTLEKLPKLKRICTARGVMVFDSIQTIRILECQLLRRIPFYLESSSHKPPCLEEIKIDSRLWWELLEWDSPTHEQVLLPFLKPGLDDLSTAIHFDDLQDFDECVQALKECRRQNLTGYHLIVGAAHEDDNNHVAEDLPRMVTLSRVEVNGGDIGAMLPDDVQCLKFRDCRGMKSLREFFKRPANLASCLIEKCEELDSVADLLPLLDGLASLSLRNLPNLQVLVQMENQLVAPIFSHLVAFEIRGCPGIKKLFPSELLNGLQNLEEIRVINCEELEEIISETPEQQREGGNKETLPKLKKVKLYECPRIKNLFPSSQLLNNLEEIEVIGCAEMEEIIEWDEEEKEGRKNETSCTLALPKLKNVTLYGLPKLKRGVVCDSIQLIYVYKCPRIKNLFPSSQLLNNLEEIKVYDCAEMEEIIEWDGEEKEGRKNETSCTLALPKLKKLILKELPKLKSLYAARGVLACDSLERIVIVRCMMLKRIPLRLPPPPSLEKIITDSEEFWESLEWDNPAAAKEVFDPLLEVDPRPWSWMWL